MSISTLMAAGATIYKGIRTAEGLKLIASEPIVVVVGTGSLARTWHMPKDLLISASPFFVAALNGCFEEATSKRVNLPEDDTNAFALFIRWLYVGEISGRLFRFEGQASGDELLGVRSGAKSEFKALSASAQVYLQACILGNKLGCPIFQDLAMLELVQYHVDDLMSVETLRIIFEQSAPGSKLRRFAIDQLRSDIQHTCYFEDADDFISAAKDIEDIGLDFLKSCMEAADCKVMDPIRVPERYLEVLTVTKSSMGTSSFIS